MLVTGIPGCDQSAGSAREVASFCRMRPTFMADRERH
jgi:hypothetical protein